MNVRIKDKMGKCPQCGLKGLSPCRILGKNLRGRRWCTICKAFIELSEVVHDIKSIAFKY